MILMIEHTIELSRSLPFIDCKSGLSKWLEDLSKAMSLFKVVHNLENATSLLEDSLIYELIYPAQSLMSNRFFEEISRRNKDSEPEKRLLKEHNDRKKTYGSSEVTTINMLLSKEEYKADLGTSGLLHENRKKSTDRGLKVGVSQAETDVKLSTDLTEVENKFPVKSEEREKLLRNIINMYGREIEDNQLGQGLNALKRVLQSPAPTSIDRSKRAEKIRAFSKRAEDVNSSESERNSFTIGKEHSPARYFKYFLSENMSEQFSRSIEGTHVSREFLDKKSGEITESNLIESNLLKPSQHSEAIVSDYLINDLKSLDSEKKLIENKEFKVNSRRMSEQFPRHIEGISVSKRSLKEKLKGTSVHNSYFPADNTSYNSKDLVSKSNQLSERKRNQFDRNQFDRNQFDRNQFDRNQFDRNQFGRNQSDKFSDSDLKISENNKQSDLLSLTSVNLLIEKAYSNSIKKSDIKEENRELLLNLIENLNQVINQTNRDTAPKKQNIFNIHISEESPTGENDLKNLSDRLVLILKDQARRHGIDLS